MGNFTLGKDTVLIRLWNMNCIRNWHLRISRISGIPKHGSQLFVVQIEISLI